MAESFSLLGMNLDPGLVYLVLGSIISVQTAVAAWVIKELIEIRGRLHRIEAREKFVDNNIGKLELHLDDMLSELLPHRKKR